MRKICVFLFLATLFVAKIGKAEEPIPGAGQSLVAKATVHDKVAVVIKSTTSSPAPPKYEGPTLKQIGGEFSKQVNVLENKHKQEKEERERGVNEKVNALNTNLVTFSNNLTDPKKGEFKRLNDKLDWVATASDSLLVTLFFGTAFIAVIVALFIVWYLKKAIRAVPERTTERVVEANINASQPDCFVVKINGRNFSYTYQADGSVLFVGADGNIAKFTDRNHVNRSLLSTFKHLSFDKKGVINFASMPEQQAAVIKDAIAKGILGFN